MLFSSYQFIFVFLPLTLIVYFLSGKFFSRRVQHSFLILASLCFYAYFHIGYLYIILASVLMNYGIASIMQRRRNYGRICLTAGIVFNIGVLGYYKYTDFFIENFNLFTGSDFPLRHILLPLGISFFTFQQFSFLLSVYDGTEKVEDFIDYALFVTFFPQLIAGPIVLYGEMAPQFKSDTGRFFDDSNTASGIYIFVTGLFKKLVIADTIALFADNGFAICSGRGISQEIGLAAAWAASLSYTFQIYFDFSGYSDMAVGLGRMFNIRLPDNFNSPYKSKSITEFWRRWHITLGRALAYYVYIPLGGNRKSHMRTCVNLMATFFVSGLWHGASWSFVLWGTLHGAFSVLDRLFERQLSRLPGALRTACTFLTVNLLWVLFRAETLGDALKVYKGLFDFRNINAGQLQEIVFDDIIVFPLPISIANVTFWLSACSLMVFCRKNSIGMRNDFQKTTKTAIATAFLFLVAIIHLSRTSPFIYFNF